DQRQPDRHQRIDPAAEYPVGDGLIESTPHVSSVLCVPATADRLMVLRARLTRRCQKGGLTARMRVEPCAVVGRTWSNWPFCHWKMNAGAPTFSPTLSNLAEPCTV